MISGTESAIPLNLDDLCTRRIQSSADQTLHSSPSNCKGCKSTHIVATGQHNQTQILASASLYDFSCNRNTCQASKAHNRVTSRIISTIVSRLTQLSHIDRGQGDVAPTRKTEHHYKHYNAGSLAAEWEPNCGDRNNCYQYTDKGTVESAEVSEHNPGSQRPKTELAFKIGGIWYAKAWRNLF